MNNSLNDNKKFVPKKTLKKILKKNLTIPPYQRTYEWKKSNVIVLFDDILKSYYSNSKINLGTIILLKCDNNEFDVVDGQQRLITLSLMRYCIDSSISSSILDDERFISPRVNNIIVDNYNLIKSIIDLKFTDKVQKDKFLSYLNNMVDFYCIETVDENKAFQLFDGRNSKYKELMPIDLLKAYHLGAIPNDMPNMKKARILYKWSINMREKFPINDYLSKNEYLFNNVLFNIYNWSLSKNRKDFDNDDIYLYKGYKDSDTYNYVEYYKSLNKKSFQINKPFKAGLEFFNMVEKYVEDFSKIVTYNQNDDSNDELYGLICKKIENLPTPVKKKYDFCNYKDSFNYYMKNTYLLYYNAMFIFYDKFGYNVDSFYIDVIKEKIFKWAITYRIEKSFASIASTNAYTLKDNNNFFYECANAVQINELLKFECQDVNITKPSDKGACGKLRWLLWNLLR